VGAENGVITCDLGVFLDEAAESITAEDSDIVVWRRGISSVGRMPGQAAVRTVGVVVIDVLGQDAAQMPLASDQGPIGTFAAEATYPAFGDRVGPRRSHRSRDEVDAHRDEGRIERRSEFGVMVADQELQLVGTPLKVHEQVAGPLRHPRPGRVR
jgi:hypothetical protein